MPNTFCLLNHELTPKQIEELHSDFGSERIIYPPDWIAGLWGAIPTDKVLTRAHIAPFTEWLQEARPGDLTVIQGEFGTVFGIVDFAFQRGLLPIYAVTKRVAQETRNGETVHRSYIFEHLCFRSYQYYKDFI